MGYYEQLTQFSKGEYQGATQTQDDFAVIANYLGSPAALPDVHGSTMATATALVPTVAGTVASATAFGVISQPDDVEMFLFTSAAGTATFQVLGPPGVATSSGFFARANLNAALTVYASNGVVVTSASGVGIPATAVNLPAQGTYYVALRAAGLGDPLTSGYSTYGSRCADHVLQGWYVMGGQGFVVRQGTEGACEACCRAPAQWQS